VQALFFGDGGLLALGANIFNMGVVPCFVVYPLLLAGGSASPGRRRAMVMIAADVTLQLGALGEVLETTASGIAELPFSVFALAMLPVHLAIGVVEGMITLAVLEFVERAEPGMLTADDAPVSRTAIGGLAVLALIAGGVLSWFASAHPDGLEWSIARLTGQGELGQRADGVHATLAQVQAKTAILPDYSFPSGEKKDGEGKAWGTPDAGTSVSGLAGGALTLLLAGFAGWAFRRRAPTDAP
jgi:cobalt/nickel transport system permease protein